MHANEPVHSWPCRATGPASTPVVGNRGCTPVVEERGTSVSKPPPRELPVADPVPLTPLAADQVDPAATVKDEEPRQWQPVPAERGPGSGEPLRVRVNKAQLATPCHPGAGTLGREQPVDRALHEVCAKGYIVDLEVLELPAFPARMTHVAGRVQVPSGPGG